MFIESDALSFVLFFIGKLSIQDSCHVDSFQIYLEPSLDYWLCVTFEFFVFLNVENLSSLKRKHKLVWLDLKKKWWRRVSWSYLRGSIFLQQEKLITLGHISYSTLHICHDLHDIIRHICNTVYSKIRFRHRLRGFPIRLYYVQIWRIIVSDVKT